MIRSKKPLDRPLEVLTSLRRLRRRLHWLENTASALCGPVGFPQASGTSD